jgi:hypothetical protein
MNLTEFMETSIQLEQDYNRRRNLCLYKFKGRLDEREKEKGRRGP